MKFNKSLIIISVIIIASFIIGIYYYPQMPDRMASHWDAQGNVNGYMSRFWGLFFMPFLSLGLSFLLVLLPNIDLLKKNFETLRKSYHRFLVIFFLFLFYVYLLTILWNLGARFDITQLMTPAMGLLIYCSGALIEKAKRNWFIGIRTIWTLNSDSVWEKTHRIGGKLFKAAGVIALLGIFFPKYAITLIMVPILGAAIVSVIYSFVAYRKEQNAVRG
ncbi:MAG: DUF1648 domain-containing protein [Dehalococcoidales bacterium]|nr:DUF1648 domain-containing protein [Dehalococcoidales bacterium]